MWPAQDCLEGVLCSCGVAIKWPDRVLFVSVMGRNSAGHIYCVDRWPRFMALTYNRNWFPGRLTVEQRLSCQNVEEQGPCISGW